MARLDDVRSLLEDEKADLEQRLAKINAALETLNGDTGAPDATTRPRSSRPAQRRSGGKRQTSSRRQPKWSKEELTCPECGFVAKAPQGLAGHIRNKHSEAAAAAETAAAETSS